MDHRISILVRIGSAMLMTTRNRNVELIQQLTASWSSFPYCLLQTTDVSGAGLPNRKPKQTAVARGIKNCSRKASTTGSIITFPTEYSIAILSAFQENRP